MTKVFIVCVQEYYDHKEVVHQISVFETLEEAKARYQTEVSDAKKRLVVHDLANWLVKESEYKWEAFYHGEWADTYYIAQIKEVEIGKIANLVLQGEC